jgi:hypothetical protein
MYALGAETTCKKRSEFTKNNPVKCRERELSIGVKITNSCHMASTGPDLAGVGFESALVEVSTEKTDFQLIDPSYHLR